MVTLDLPLKVTFRIVPGVMFPELLCHPTVTAPKVTGWVPKRFVRKTSLVTPEVRFDDEPECLLVSSDGEVGQRK